jgi:heterodisulfide reductase subunit A
MRPAAEVLEKKLERLEKSGARILTGTDVDDISGYVGNFEVRLSGASEETFGAGAIILAIGASLHDPQGEYGYGEYPNVITSQQLEKKFCEDGSSLEVDGKRPSSAAFILCVGSRDPDAYGGCSRYCCPTAIKQAIVLAKQGIDTTIFYRDIRTISSGAEEMYREARGLGVLFVRIPPDEKVAVIGRDHAWAVRCFDELLNRQIEVPVDLVVLSVGMRPRQPDADRFHMMLKASLGLDGFFLERHPELAPAETSVEGVFLAGTLQGPKDIVDTVAQASAAAAKAAVFLSFDKAKQHPAIAVLDQEVCSKCGQCAAVCPYNAIEWIKKQPAHIVEAMCAGCGTCGATCKFGAITMQHFSDDQMLSQIRALLSDAPQDKVVVFACNWCSYAGADMAGISRMQYPASTHLIRTMCSGRVSEDMVLEAFLNGAPVVLVSGCHFSDCHYISANRQTVKRVHRLWDKMERTGVRPERLQLEWISAAEGQKFAKVMHQMEDLRQGVKPDEIEHSMQALKPKPKKPRKPKAKAAAKPAPAASD